MAFFGWGGASEPAKPKATYESMYKDQAFKSEATISQEITGSNVKITRQQSMMNQAILKPLFFGGQ